MDNILNGKLLLLKHKQTHSKVACPQLTCHTQWQNDQNSAMAHSTISSTWYMLSVAFVES